MGITAVVVVPVLMRSLCALRRLVYTPVLDWAHARDTRRNGEPPGPARRLHGDRRPPPARHHHRRAPAERGPAHGAPAGDAAPRVGDGDDRRAAAGRTGRRLLPA